MDKLIIYIDDQDDWVTVEMNGELIHEGHSISSRDLAYILKDIGCDVTLTFEGEVEVL